MADNMRMSFLLEFAAKTAGLTDSAKLARALGDELNETDDDAAALARAMSAAADLMEADLAEAARMASLLGNALGPELTAKIGQTRLDGIAREFQSVGLSVDQVEGNIDGLANGVRRLETVADSAGDGVRRIGDNADNSRSVMANFTGNAISTLPGVTDAFGPLNMAIGQFTEYATEGNIKLKNLAAMAPFIGIAAAAMWNLSDNTERMAKAKAFRTDNVKAYAKALENAENAQDAINDKLRETEILLYQAGEAGDGYAAAATHGVEVNIDMSETFDRLGVTLGDVSTALIGGQEGVDAYTRSLEAQGVSAADAAAINGYLRQELEDFNTVQEAAERRARFLGDEVESLGRKADAAAGGTDVFKKSIDKLRGAIEDADGIAEGLEGHLKGIRDIIDEIDDSEAARDLADQFDATKKAMEEAFYAGKTGAEDFAEKQRDAAREADNLTLEIIEYGNKLGGLPTEKVTDIKALIDQGSIDAAWAELRRFEQARTVTLFLNAVASSSGGGSSSNGGTRALEALGASRSGDTYNINVTVQAAPGASAHETGVQIGEAITAVWRDGYRWEWMGGTR